MPPLAGIFDSAEIPISSGKWSEEGDPRWLYLPTCAHYDVADAVSFDMWWGYQPARYLLDWGTIRSLI